MTKKPTYEELESKVKELERICTSNNHVEKRIVENDEMIFQIVNGSPIPTFVIDENHRVICWNRACESLTGFTAKEIIGNQ